jgi:hypothetical protein
MFQPGCPKPCPTARVLKHPKLEPQAKVLLGDTTPDSVLGTPSNLYMSSRTDRIFFHKVQEPTGEQLVAPNFQESVLALQGADAQGLGGHLPNNCFRSWQTCSTKFKRLPPQELEH